MFGAKVHTIFLNVTVNWQYGQEPESGQWIGVCPALNINALGETVGELIVSANQSTALLFADLFETGELAAFLEQHGWSLQVPLPPLGTRVRFDVPVDITRVPLSELREFAAA